VNTISIEGVVSDSVTQKPIELAAVTITKENDSTIITGSITDFEGKFKLNIPNPGKYTLHYSFVGYNETNKNINVDAGKPMVFAGKTFMTLDATTLDDVNITVQKEYFQSSIDKKVYNIEKDIVASGGSASDALQTIPSVVIDIDGNISLRGSEGVRIFIDGKPSGIVGSNMNAILEQIPASSIESIEVVTNPSARYEAEGSSGIINIVLKKNKKSGLNGNITAGISTTPKYEAGASLNFRNQKLNFYSNYSYVHDDRDSYGSTFRKTFEPDTTFYLASESNSNSISQMNMLRTGLDYYINDKNTIGVSASLHSGNSNRADNGAYTFLDLDSTLTSTSNRLTEGENTGKSFGAGMNYRKIFNDPKHLLTADLFYSQGTGTDMNDYSESFFDADNIEMGSPLLQFVSRPSKNVDANAQTDYVRPFKNGNQFETGLKYTKEVKDNTIYSESFDEVINDWQPDDTINNQFIYNEDVIAAYVIWNSSFKKFGYQLGLRAEQTYTTSDLVTTDETFNKDYFGLFPSVHVVYKFNEGTELGASYSRRIDRPNAWFLNPFPDYSDPYSFRAGNPFLEPEYENSYEISFNKDFKKHSLSASVYYHHVLNEISPYTIVNEEGISFMTFQNYNEEKKYGLELVGKNEFYKWWNMTSSINFNQTLLDAQNLELGLTNSQFTYNIRVMSFFQVLKQTAFQLTFSYNTPWTFAQGESQPIYFLDAGLKSDFFQNKLSVNLSMSDVFDTRIWEGNSEGINFYSEYSRKRQSQIAALKLTWKFGQQDNRRRNSKGMEENYDGGGIEMF
ncbi:MAG: TonB-dependent receptor domain-containing protein, partial [Chitinophagales bacterium]